MRWMWIDRVVELVPGERLVAVKNVTFAEEHLDAPSTGSTGDGVMPAMPGSLIVEGMAQTAGILVGHGFGFAHNVVLAKIGRVDLACDALPGDTLRYTATIQQQGEQGASTQGSVEIAPAGAAEKADHFRPAGRVDLVFSVLPPGAGGDDLPEGNFVFGPAFRLLLEMSGVSVPDASANA